MGAREDGKQRHVEREGGSTARTALAIRTGYFLRATITHGLGPCPVLSPPTARSPAPFPVQQRTPCRFLGKRGCDTHAGVRNITYDITELYGFIDGLGDLCCLVRVRRGYSPPPYLVLS